MTEMKTDNSWATLEESITIHVGCIHFIISIINKGGELITMMMVVGGIKSSWDFN